MGGAGGRTFVPKPNHPKKCLSHVRSSFSSHFDCCIEHDDVHPSCNERLLCLGIAKDFQERQRRRRSGRSDTQGRRDRSSHVHGRRHRHPKQLGPCRHMGRRWRRSWRTAGRMGARRGARLARFRNRQGRRVRTQRRKPSSARKKERVRRRTMNEEARNCTNVELT